MSTTGYARFAALLGWLALGLYGLVSGVRLGFGSLANPDAGFVPALAGGMLMVLALVVALGDARAFVRRHDLSEPDDGSRWPPLVALVLLALYAALFERLGFFGATLLAILALAVLIGRLGVTRSLVLAAAAAGIGHVVFKLLLKVPLP